MSAAFEGAFEMGRPRRVAATQSAFECSRRRMRPLNRDTAIEEGWVEEERSHKGGIRWKDGGGEETEERDEEEERRWKGGVKGESEEGGRRKVGGEEES